MKIFYKTITISLITLFGVLVFQGCASSNPPVVLEEELHVDVIYLDRMMLPPNAKVTMILENISKQDVKSKVLVKSSLMVKNAPPYSFTIKYDYNSIDMKKVYNLWASITVDGKYIYRSDTVLNPFTDIRDKYELVVKRVLINTSWKLVSLEEKNITVHKNMKEPYIFFEKDEKSVKGFGGCNSMFGSFSKEGQNIKIGPLASTKKACMYGMDTEAEFYRAISKTKKWHIYGNVLKLADEHGKTLAKFEAK